MALNLEHAPGATPLDPDEVAGLIPGHLTTHAQLNEFELANIVVGETWAFARARPDLLTDTFLRELHRRMFGDTWRWAGRYRTSEKNIGIDPLMIGPAVRDVCADVGAQLEHASYPLDEIAARLSHRLVKIHPFANGNGRWSRTVADLLLVREGAARFSWGAANFVATGEVRQRYIAALRAADGGDYAPLIEFVRS